MKVNPLSQRLEDGKSRLSVIFCGEINIGGDSRNAPPRTNLSIPMAAAPEVEAVAIILMNAVVAAIDDFESDQSFLVGMGSVEEGEIPEGGMEGAEGLKESLTKYLGRLEPMSWSPKADDLGVLTDLISDFEGDRLLAIRGAEEGPEVYLGWSCDFAWGDRTSDELECFKAVCSRVLAGLPVALNADELEEVAAVFSVDLKSGSDGKWTISSGDYMKSADSVQEAAKLVLTDRSFWCPARPIRDSSASSPQVPKAPVATQDPLNPSVFHEDGRAFRYERGYRIYL